MEDRLKPRVLFAVTGSVATIKINEIARGLLALGCEVRVIATRSATHFFAASPVTQPTEADIPAYRSEVEGVPVYTDEDEYSVWAGRGDPVLHIRLRDWADYFLVAPLSANSLAKMANGLCDNLVTCVFRAWDFKKPVLLAPAMNTHMWESPFTAKHFAVLTAEPLNCGIIGPIEQLLECLDYGLGAMTKPPEILAKVKVTLPSQDVLVERRERMAQLLDKRKLMLDQRIQSALREAK